MHYKSCVPIVEPTPESLRQPNVIMSENHTISVVARRFRSAFEEVLSGDSKG